MLFGAPHLLQLLWAVPVLGVLAVGAALWRRRRLARWVESGLRDRLAPARSGFRRGLRVALTLAALAFAVFAAARPQVGAKLVQVERQGIDVLVVLDVSLSMEATDVVPSRLERCKQEIRELLDGLPGDRVGLVIFSGSAFLLCPLTLDAGAANLFLDSVTADVLPDPGTNIAEALTTALRSLGEKEKETRTVGGRAVVVFTDGEAHEGDPLALLPRFKDAGISILTVGVGTPQGEPIPVLDASGRLSGYKQDRSGNVVLSRLDEGLLRELAARGEGAYFPATLQGHEVHEILDFLRRLERGELGGTQRRRVDERFQVPAAVAAVLWLLAFLVPEARPAERRGREGKSSRRKGLKSS